MPFPEEDGISLPAGFETVINLHLVSFTLLHSSCSLHGVVLEEEHRFLGEPYGACREPHVNKYGYHYSAVVRVLLEREGEGR